MNPRVKRITYEEVIDGENDAISTRPLSQEKGLDLEWNRSILKRVDILSMMTELTEKSET